MKRQKNMTSEDEPSFWLRLECIQYATGEKRGQVLIAPEEMKQPGQSSQAKATMLSFGCVC